MPSYLFQLKSSRFYLGLLSFIYLGAVIILFWIPIPTIFKIILLALCIYRFSRDFQQFYALSHPESVQRLRFMGGKHWYLQTSKGESKAQLTGEVTCHPGYVFLRFKALNASKKVPILIWRDSLPEKDFRRLRVLLRFMVNFAHE